MTLPGPPSRNELEAFPTITWFAHQPLSRVHRQQFGAIFYGSDQDGRWNPPDTESTWGTCYFSTSPIGAMLEVFGRFRVIHQREIDRRVLAEFYPPSDLRLVDVTHPSVIGRFGLTAEASTGYGTSTFGLTQRWANAFYQAGFAGVHYAARHDPTLGSRSIALFGKASVPEAADDPEAEWVDDAVATSSPISPDLLRHLADEYGFRVVAGGSTL